MNTRATVAWTLDDFAHGTTTIGLYRPSTNTLLLRNRNTFGAPDLIIPFGAPNDLPVVGDWDGRP